MEINSDILKKNQDIIQTIKRVSSSLFFCMYVNGTRYYSGAPLINYVYSWTMKIWLCLPGDHSQG